jgi:predicted transcriptional regulator
MERAHVFEAILVIVLIILAGLLYIAIVSPTAPTATGWEMQGNGSVRYMFTGSNDTLYIFQPGNVTAIESNGRVAWNLHVPEPWKAIDINGYEQRLPLVDEAGGFLYLCLIGPVQGAKEVDNDTFGVRHAANVTAKLIAISPSGRVSWEYPFIAGVVEWDDYGGVFGYLSGLYIRSFDGRIYLLHNNQEDVLDSNGKLLFTIGNTTEPVAVDESGRIYAVYATGVKAYDQDGKPLWSSDIGENIVGTYDYNSYPPVYRCMPQYANGTLYVPLNNGTAAIGTDGHIKWVRHVTRGIYMPFGALPVDSRGYAYLMIPQPDWYTYVCSISPDGVVNEDAWRYGINASIWPGASDDGTVYLVTDNSPFPYPAFNSTVDAGPMPIITVTALDIGRNRELWNFSVPSEDVRRVTLNAKNWDTVVPNINTYILDDNKVPGLFRGLPADSFILHHVPDTRITINPGKNIVYISYYSGMYESPIIFNRSQAVYVNSLYALDNNGTLLWKQPIDGYVTHTVAGNETFYYNTYDGRIGGSKVNIAAGIALAALAYVFLRFFMLGTISRAKTRLDQNENRNVVRRYIVANPGVTATDLARDLSMNIGTIRYHLFILTMNHKVITHRADNKYLRYFTNAGTYSKEEQSLLALLRRKPLWETLRAVAEKPGLSGPELAEKLNVSTTVAHRDLTMLSQKGIIVPVLGSDRGHGYVIRSEQRERVEKAMELLRPKEG